jgi:hypothetical protein
MTIVGYNIVMTAARTLANLNSSALANVDITSTGNNNTPLFIDAASGQSADLAQFRSSSGSVISRVNSSGNFISPGSVIQTAFDDSITAQSVTSSSYVAISNLSVSITPKLATSKFLVTLTVSGYSPNPTSNGHFAIYRNSTMVAQEGYVVYQTGEFFHATITYLDSPETTSLITYAGYTKNMSANAFTLNYVDSGGQCRSTITVQEIAQ